LDLWGKGYLAMGILMLVQTTVNITKTLRDNAESDKLIRKIEDAKTEKLLVNLNRSNESYDFLTKPLSCSPLYNFCVTTLWLFSSDLKTGNRHARQSDDIEEVCAIV